MLWNQTHRDVHPDPTRYHEVRDRTYAFAAAIKSADPSALTAGPTVWGLDGLRFALAAVAGLARLLLNYRAILAKPAYPRRRRSGASGGWVAD